MIKELLGRVFGVQEKGTGALPDTRTDEAKEKDFTFEEIVASIEPVNWLEKPESKWRKFPIFDQNGSGSCVAQTLSKLLGILYWLKNREYVHFSATHIYQRRSNRPRAGMNGVNALDIAREGTTLEVLAPSEGMTDSQMDGYRIEQYKSDVGEVFKIGNYVVMPTRDIDTIASTIQRTGKGVMVWFYFTRAEWTDVPRVISNNLGVRGSSTLRHSVTAVDYTMYKGKKALVIEDSWGLGHAIQGRRIITEDFFKIRNFFSAYPINFAFAKGESDKPNYNFTRTLEFGERSTDIGRLQDILKYEGMFPANVDSTGYYGAITARAVDEFQRKYSVAPTSELDSLKGRRVGNKTLEVLNSKYSRKRNH